MLRFSGVVLLINSGMSEIWNLIFKIDQFGLLEHGDNEGRVTGFIPNLVN